MNDKDSGLKSGIINTYYIDAWKIIYRVIKISIRLKVIIAIITDFYTRIFLIIYNIRNLQYVQ